MQLPETIYAVSGRENESFYVMGFGEPWHPFTVLFTDMDEAYEYYTVLLDTDYARDVQIRRTNVVWEEV